MPALYAGATRPPATFPVQYLKANVPQAWAAGSCFAFLQAMLGFQPDAPNGKLYLDPQLPEWLPELTLKDMWVCGKRLAIRIWREGTETRWEVIRGDATMVVPRCCATGPRLLEVALRPIVFPVVCDLSEVT
ncbi:hypothetical protein EN792_062180 [Mesorhizobium sp. M00.F.Ca.ET.149.01.1.1]|nr:hypothetical protein EN792_062180 [Mesorhizobium sp. M00.F.Ca.ET.149.01.1.1]